MDDLLKRRNDALATYQALSKKEIALDHGLAGYGVTPELKSLRNAVAEALAVVRQLTDECVAAGLLKVPIKGPAAKYARL